MCTPTRGKGHQRAALYPNVHRADMVDRPGNLTRQTETHTLATGGGINALEHDCGEVGLKSIKSVNQIATLDEVPAGE